MSGTEIDRLEAADLQSVVRSAAVFYRVTPKHKVRIVKALQVTSLKCLIKVVSVEFILERVRIRGIKN